MPDPVDGARLLADLGCDLVIHHPLDRLREIVEAVAVPVQAVGGLALEQATETPKFGAPLVVIGAPLAIEADSFRTAVGDVERVLQLISEKVHAYGDVPVGKGRLS